MQVVVGQGPGEYGTQEESHHSVFRLMNTNSLIAD
jgi:hypothetical protein